MSAKDNSITHGTTIKQLNTPLKASVVLVSAMLMAACGSNGTQSYNLEDVFGSSQLPGGSVSQDELDKAEKEKAEAEERAEAAKKAKEEAEAAAAEQKAKAEAAQQEAAEQKAKAEAAQKEAADAKAQLEKIQAQLDQAIKDLEEALASGGSNTEYFEAQVELKENELKEAQAAVDAATQEAESAQQKAEAQAEAAAAAQKAVQDAQAAAAINNDPEAAKSGVQSINVGTSVAGLEDFVITTRDFDIGESNVVARADLASNNLLPKVDVNISGEGDTELENGFKSHNDSTSIPTALGDLPFAYTSVYKDYGDDMRIGHIDGAANLNGKDIPVDGIAAVGNATKAENIPTEGTVGYTGDATHRKLGIGNAIEFGSSVFTADFVAKNLAGKLSFANAGDINLKANINGNKFSGAADANGGYATEGGFFGGDAQYLGGVYEGNEAQGTYGAKSDKQTVADQAAADAQEAAEAAQQALAAQQAQAEAAQAAAAEAKAEVQKAEEALEKAKAALENAGQSGNEQALKDALEKAQAEAEKAKADAEAAIKEANEKAQQEVTAAQEQVKAAEEQTKLAQDQANAAKAAEAEAKAAADAAEKEAADKIAAAESAAKEDIAEANKIAEEAKAKAKTAQDNAEQAEADRIAAEQAAEKAETAKAAAEQAKAEADKRIKELEAELEALKNPDAYKSEAEADKSGAQHLRIDVTAVSDQIGVKKTTSRDFIIRSSSDVDARADLALEGLVNDSVAIKVSGENDAETSNGFKAYEGTGNVLSEGDLAYTSTYKDFGDSGELRIAHIDGSVMDGAVPVNGVVVLGNKTETLPTEGTANYAGDATNRKLGVNSKVEYGSSEFTADFVNKSLDGTLKFKQAGEIGLSANIDGNEFSGNTADNNGYNTEGAFYGKNANFIGGIYEGKGSQGTFGAEKNGTPATLVEPEPETPEPLVNPDAKANEDIGGFMSNTLSSEKGLGTENRIGFRQFINDKQSFTTTSTDENGEVQPNLVESANTNNFIDFAKFDARLDTVKPEQFTESVVLTTVRADDVDAGNGFMKSKAQNTDAINNANSPIGKIELKVDYNSVYKNFDSVMQIGHVYGDLRKEGLAAGVKSRYANVYAIGKATAQEDMDYLKALSQYNVDNGINDGLVAYKGDATYVENIHLLDRTAMSPVVNGISEFKVDFINDKLSGTLAFEEGNYKYMPEGNKIGIEANISGNTFANENVGNTVHTSGGFFGEDAQFLGGIYQDNEVKGGSGDVAGTGTKFQGTFGAEKQ
ncbi:transferrin-binding protein-like solute binding protein [Psychrobacter phenylpyruvicus]|uniref:Transcription initiation factor TFIID, subunit TAF12 (Also component of histone acetyltransferase SAGA) n=1 Tax=Psychrobacter phenylpyruvicus TaxID=29432 RepID=A0A379LIW1_9GAMM|nr:transferrin-binding protein-like solute binding protein [Psychrobacter phenylpyruvicus]SUD90025.1 Transcription initiation factor TFIID, subunit TAF12 (also component of histone acetyltransferase SAGA) [Psychrobacter phenylpyruvicus]